MAQNTTYEDTNNGTPFYANFRDVALIGNTMYMPLQSQGKIVTAVDATLNADKFEGTPFNIYPNPTKDKFTIELNNSSVLKNVTIYSNLGQLVLTSKESIINISNLTSGLYILEIETNKGKSSKKLIVE